jgi:acetylxylan esterase
MRGFLTTLIGVLAATAAAADSNTTCATGLYILCARGSGETSLAIPNGPPADTGSPGILALQIAAQINGSVIAGVSYPATDPVSPNISVSSTGIVNLTAPGSVNLTGYYPSEDQGVQNLLDEVNQYHAACPDSKIALIGYSQGAQVVQDAMCGGTGGLFNSDAPLSPDLVKKNGKLLSLLLRNYLEELTRGIAVVAVAVFGDPTHIANLSIDRGASDHDGVSKHQMSHTNILKVRD